MSIRLAALFLSAALLAGCGSAAPAAAPASSTAPSPSASASAPAKPSASAAASAVAAPASAALSASAKPSGGVTKLNVGLGQAVGQVSPVWIAQDAGIFAKSNLEVDSRVAAATTG